MRIGQLAGRRSWLLVGLLASFTTLLAAFVPTVQAESQSRTENARDAVGLLEDNQERCLRLAHGKLDILETDFRGNERTDEIEHYLREQNRTSVRVSKKSLEISHGLIRRLQTRGKDSMTSSLWSMFGGQNDLCDWASSTRLWSTASIYREQIRSTEERFGNAKSSLPPEFHLGSEEIRAVVQKYRDQLYGTSGDVSDESIARAMEEDRSLLSDQPISTEEYQRKQKEYAEWLAEQERREAEKARLQAQRRAALQERQKQAPQDMPKVELKTPAAEAPDKGTNADPEAMAQWHSEYSTRIVPFKKSLGAYLKVPNPTSRTLMMGNACRDLARTAQGVLKDPVVLEAPDLIVGKLLHNAMTLFKQASDSCLNNRLQKARDLVTEGSRHLGRAKMALEPYGLGL